MHKCPHCGKPLDIAVTVSPSYKFNKDRFESAINSPTDRVRLDYGRVILIVLLAMVGSIIAGYFVNQILAVFYLSAPYWCFASLSLASIPLSLPNALKSPVRGQAVKVNTEPPSKSIVVEHHNHGPDRFHVKRYHFDGFGQKDIQAFAKYALAGKLSEREISGPGRHFGTTTARRITQQMLRNELIEYKDITAKQQGKRLTRNGRNIFRNILEGRITIV